eukprot:CAMPEP_0182424482 /NCGR_PEP_ID=MMETSP1167-20130531/10693_1 /TAXON_ID=2988 /ORGANISM="Mallomonas Sp, Strain CCMP3275" /LENGTH=861 /DNA_ID=CAMNT_0024604331 /DNA_START=153 /DNA_END=2738 /DNA_ORIENTATION=+
MEQCSINIPPASPSLVPLPPLPVIPVIPSLSSFNEESDTTPPMGTQSTDQTAPAKKFLDIGSISSSSMMLFTAADDSLARAPDSRHPPEHDPASSDPPSLSLSQSIQALRRLSPSYTSPPASLRLLSSGGVGNYRNLFKKTISVEFEADSPAFRKKVELLDDVVGGLRTHLQSMVTACREFCQSGGDYSIKAREFSGHMVGLKESVWVSHLGELGELLSAFGTALDEMHWYRDQLLSSLETTFSSPMDEFVKREVKTVKRLKQALQKNSEEYEQALSKFLSLKTSADSDLFLQKEADLAMLRRRFELSRYDLVTELNGLETKKKFQLSERIVSAVYAHLGYFHSCHSMLLTIEPAMRQLMNELNAGRKEFAREVMLRQGRRSQLVRELDRASASTAAKANAKRQARPSEREREKEKNRPNKNTRMLGKLQHIGSSSPKHVETETDMSSRGEREREDGQVKAGYLWKKASNFQKAWGRRWFFISNGKLYYQKAPEGVGSSVSMSSSLSLSPPPSLSLSHQNSPNVGGGEKEREREKERGNVQFVCDLLISSVRENVEEDMRFTFQIISPGQRVYVLQGESEEDSREWIRVIRQQIESLLGRVGEVEEEREREKGGMVRNTEYFSPTTTVLQPLREVNPVCVDCGAEAPEWASVNLCVMVCIECSGTHRGMGTHVSKVRSLTLDKWTPNHLKMIELISNTRSNMIWEERQREILETEREKQFTGDLQAAAELHKPNHNSSREHKEMYIIAKYVKKRFVRQLSQQEANELMYRAASLGDLFSLLSSLAMGGDVNHRNEQEQLRFPLHAACIGGHVLCVEFLCHNNANVDAMDISGRTPLDYASIDNNNGIIDILVQKLERDLQL